MKWAKQATKCHGLKSCDVLRKGATLLMMASELGLEEACVRRVLVVEP